MQLAMDSAGNAFGAFSDGVYESVAPGATGSMNTQLSTGAATRLAADAAGDVVGYFPTARPTAASPTPARSTRPRPGRGRFPPRR